MILLSALVGAFCAASVNAQTGAAGPSGPSLPPAVDAAVKQLVADATKTPGALDAAVIYTDVTAVITAAVAALQSGSSSPQAQAQVGQLAQIQSSVDALKTAGTPPQPKQIEALVTVITGLFTQQGPPPAADTTAVPKNNKKKKPALNVG